MSDVAAPDGLENPAEDPAAGRRVHALLNRVRAGNHDRERACAISTKCVYSQSGLTLDFMAARKGEFSRIASIEPGDTHEGRRSLHQPIAVQTISLDELLVEHGAPRRIDYMSI